MNIRQLNSFVREKAGAPSPAVLKSDEITLALLSEITARQSQMIAAGKPIRTDIETLIPVAKSGSITFVSGQTGAQTKSRPDIARIRQTGSSAWSLIAIANDLEALSNYEAQGIDAVLLHSSPLKYELSFEPQQHEIEFWFDKEVSSLLDVATNGSGLPEQFDFMIGIASAIKCLPRLLLRDENSRVFVELQIQILERELMRLELDWQQFLYQSVAAGSSSRKTPFKVRNFPRRLRRFPY